MRILLVRLGAMGDIVHTLPLLHDLWQAGHQVDWLVEDRWASLLRGCPAINQVITLPRKEWKSQQRSLWGKLADLSALGRQLKARQYQRCIDAQGLAKSALAAHLSGAPRIGFSRGRARELSWLGSTWHVAPEATHVIDQNRRLATALNIDNSQTAWQFPLPAWQEQQAEIDAWLEQQNLAQPLALNVGAGWPSKVWPVSHQIAFCQLLVAHGHRPLLIWGSPAEQEVAQQVHLACPTSILAPRTDLPQLVALLRRCRLVVSGDTGPLHLSRAVNTPAIGLFGPVPAERNGPRGLGYRNLQADGAAWERHDASKGGMDQLSPEMVWQQITEALQEYDQAVVTT